MLLRRDLSTRPRIFTGKESQNLCLRAHGRKIASAYTRGLRKCLRVCLQATPIDEADHGKGCIMIRAGFHCGPVGVPQPSTSDSGSDANAAPYISSTAQAVPTKVSVKSAGSARPASCSTVPVKHGSAPRGPSGGDAGVRQAGFAVTLLAGGCRRRVTRRRMPAQSRQGDVECQQHPAGEPSSRATKR